MMVFCIIEPEGSNAFDIQAVAFWLAVLVDIRIYRFNQCKSAYVTLRGSGAEALNAYR